MVNSQDKGKRFEREVANLISEVFGVDCSRVPNSGGLTLKGDIMSLEGIPARYNWECKNNERLNIWKALKQSEDDAEDKVPVVVFTRNHAKDYAALPLQDFLDLLLELVDCKITKEE